MTSPVFFCFHPNNWPSDEVVENKSGGTNHYFINTDWNWVLQTYLRLRERGRRLPAVLITTSQPAVMLRAARAGVPVIEKPLVCDRLVGEVRRLIDADSSRPH